MKFAFELCQRVTAPGSNGRIQGIVVGASAAVGMENQYIVSAMTDEGKSGSVRYGEAVLIAAQKIMFRCVTIGSGGGAGGGAGGYRPKSSLK